MNNSTIPGEAESAAPTAAFPTSSTPTPGVEQTPDAPVTDLQISSPDGLSAPISVQAKPINNLPVLPALPHTIGLQQRQRVVLQALAAGESVRAAASAAGINPSTVFRWRRYDACFIAAFNAWQAHSQQSARDCLIAANEHAARTILRATQNGNITASLAVLKGLGTLAPQKVGPEIAGLVERILETESDKTKLRLGSPTSEMKCEQAFRREQEKQAAAKAEAERVARAENERIYFERYLKLPPLPRPITPLDIEQSVRMTIGNITTYRERCSFTITAVSGDLNALAAYISEHDQIPIETAKSQLSSLPLRLTGVTLSNSAESVAQKLESLGATVELRPAWRR